MKFEDYQSEASQTALYPRRMENLEYPTLGLAGEAVGALTRLTELSPGDAGLQEELFQPTEEIRKDFYAEKPIKIRLSGSYHEFGKFVSDIAALPRIVTLHDIEAAPKSKDATFDELVLNVTAKTYRYLDEDEVASVAAEDDAKTARDKKGKARTTRDTSKGNAKAKAKAKAAKKG